MGFTYREVRSIQNIDANEELKEIEENLQCLNCRDSWYLYWRSTQALPTPYYRIIGLFRETTSLISSGCDVLSWARVLTHSGSLFFVLYLYWNILKFSFFPMYMYFETMILPYFGWSESLWLQPFLYLSFNFYRYMKLFIYRCVCKCDMWMNSYYESNAWILR